MFDITNGGSGFRMTFANGWTVSVQFGAGNYCEQRDMPFGQRNDWHSSRDAECAVLNPAGVLVKIGENDQVIGWQAADDVAALIAQVSSYPRK